MKTVLMFPYANHLGGTQPLVAIGTTLREAGHNVVFAARGQCRAYVEECGFEVEDVIELDPERSVAYINKSSLDYHTLDSIAEFVGEETALIRQVQRRRSRRSAPADAEAFGAADRTRRAPCSAIPC